MAGLHGREPPADDMSDFSDDEPLHSDPQSSHQGVTFSTIGSSGLGQLAAINRNEYSDEDIKIVYEIVTRAETILAEELTPTSRLPTHALFLAYDEIIAEYGLDPSERHISRVVFLVGGVKGQGSLMEKFKTVMDRMNITVSIEEPQSPAREHGHRGGHYVDGDAENFSRMDDGSRPAAHHGKPEYDGNRLSSASLPDSLTESLDIAGERHLAEKAETFRRSHQAQLAVAAFRRWHSTSRYINYLSAQSDATRDAELKGDLEINFNIWRALAAETAHAAPDSVHPNAYSKRTERIAMRAREIFLAKKVLVKWRHVVQQTHQKLRDAHPLTHRPAKQQEYDESDFEENPQLARLAQRAHRNLVLSQAFAAWSNRADEETAKADVAALAYEMSLKAKVLGVARDRSAIDAMRELLASKIGKSAQTPANNAISSATRQPELPAQLPAQGATRPISAIPFPSQPLAPSKPPLSSEAIASQLQNRNHPKPPPTTIPIINVPPIATPSDDTGETAHTPDLQAQAVPIEQSPDDSNSSEDEKSDEQTMLARRHILRMRYFGAWERYTDENIAKVEEFGEERQTQRVMRSVSKWRDQAASQPQRAAECKIEFEETRSYRRAAKIVDKWRRNTDREAHHRGKMLELYARRAEYYQKITRALPVLRVKTVRAEHRENLLEQYAGRCNYYLRATQALSTWRERAQEASQMHQLQEYYGGRADYYYRVTNTLATWQQKAKQRRKDRLKEAHLETRRMVKRGMGARCIKQWRIKLEPSYERYELMNVTLVDVLEDRELRHASEVFTEWRHQAQEQATAAATAEAMLTQKAVERWQEKAALHRDLEAEAGEHWETRAKSRALKNWNLGSLQNANRPEMVASALEKRERRLQRQGFETWYGRTADRLVPVELPDGTYRNVNQVVEGARHRAAENRARGLLRAWKANAAAAAGAAEAGSRDATRRVQNEAHAYAPTPGRPHLMLGSFGRRETTTPLAPVPSRARWQARDSAMGRSERGARPAGRSDQRAKGAKNLRVSWAA
ncbi:hypothetical protein F4802DRAFT_617149 [Xylaria palmicola]|nr:hypothetical protein F4802DRAFT_617149 [Xylaria palmicola]